MSGGPPADTRDPANKAGGEASETPARTAEAGELLGNAWQAHQAGQVREAERLYQQVLSQNPDDPDALHLLGLLSHQSGRSEAAVELLRLAIRKKTGDASYHANLALILDSLGRFADAAGSNRRALELNPDSFGACFGLANEQRMLGDVEAAVATYRRALQINPQHAGALSNLGSALEALGRHDEAVGYFLRAAEFAPGQPGIFSNLGNALQGAGRFEEAVEAFRQATRLDPAYADAHCNLGVALLQNSKLDEALAAFDDCLRVAPAQRSALAFKSIALHESGEHEQARELCDLSRFVVSRQFTHIPGFADVDAFNEALTAHVLSHKTLEYEPFSKSTRRGQQSGNLLAGEKGPVARLEEMIRREVSAYLERAPFPAGHPYRNKGPKEWSLNIWSTVLDNQGYQAPHMHPGGWLSGVYYVRLPACVGEQSMQGFIEFGAVPEELGCTGEQPVRLIRPETGKMLIFPSYFFHRTIPFESNEQRISIAFDVVPED